MLITIDDIGFRRTAVRRAQEHLFNNVLNFLNVHDFIVKESFCKVERFNGELSCDVQVKLISGHACLVNSISDLFRIEFNQAAVSFFDFSVHQDLPEQSVYMKMSPFLYPSTSTGEGGVGVVFILRCAQLRAWGVIIRLSTRCL